jgi:hypothetical protein
MPDARQILTMVTFESSLDRMGLISVFLLTLFLLLLGAGLGFLFGRTRRKSAADLETSHLLSVENGILGLLALLLGFSFAMAVSRYEARRQLVITEANTIGTALLRTQFLAPPYDKTTEAIIRRYLDLRVESAKHIDYGESKGMLDETAKVQQELWAQVTAAMREDNKSQANALFAASVNEMIDTQGDRTGALRAYVPRGVIAILLLLAFVALTMVGYVEGLTTLRHWAAPLIVASLIAVVMTLIADLDRPREGLIETSQQSMIDLQKSLK